MARWTWQAKDRAGQACQGELEASSKAQALQQVKRLGVYAVSVNVGQSPSRLLGSTTRHKTPHAKQILWLTEQLTFLCNAGLPVLAALDLLRAQPLPPALLAVVNALHQHLQQGMALPQAFAACNSDRPIFSESYVGSLNAAQQSGLLGPTFSSLAQQLQFSANLKAQLRSALSYPSVLVFFSVLIVLALLVFVVPTFEQQFAQQGLTLPWPTALLLALSRWLAAYLPALVLAVAGLLLVGRTWLLRNRVHPSRRFVMWRLVFHKWLLRSPLLGPLLWHIYAAQWAHACAQLLGTGVPLLDALRYARSSLANAYLREQLLAVQQALAQGMALSAALKDVGIFQANVWAVCAVGEATGNMAQALAHISVMLRAQVEQQVKLLTSLLEPAAVLVVGVLIGAIVLAMYWPIFELGRTV